MRGIDFSSWQALFTTLLGLALFILIGVGIRALMIVTIQQRRERMNRQINERLRTLIAAYRTLGGSFTGDLTVDPRHLRDLRRGRGDGRADPVGALDYSDTAADGSDRTRRVRDAVEAALSDIILLGTEEHVRLAESAARELVAGRPVHTQALVVSLRSFIREALDLEPIPPELAIPNQGPTRPAGSGGKGDKAKGEGSREGRDGGQGASGTGMGEGGLGGASGSLTAGRD